VPNLTLSAHDEWKKSTSVIASNTGNPVDALSASAYAGSSVHSNKIPCSNGSFSHTSSIFFTSPGCTIFGFTASPFATASNPGTSSHPTTMNLSLSTVIPQSVNSMSMLGVNVFPFAVKIANFASFSYAHTSIGACSILDMNTGHFALLRTNTWNAIMNPQSPVMPTTPCFSNQMIAFSMFFSTGLVIFPDWAISNVSPSTCLKRILYPYESSSSMSPSSGG